ncbi:MAG: isochorismatase family protein [Candidatus Cellulosilyticum pullistercoris]|uniref:nicotinamidase n=1 Tax=Candidatus Cellulosilyticum pullistercoris TaxID=2838521 RepID=A0A9E2KCB3_9FIRM|nr:isochorismatase family protein [Candidatus Cellulosilyticum pullistercoris]
MEEIYQEKLPEWEKIKDTYYKWYQFMEREVSFSLKDSQKHTKEHCARVLLYALVIANRMGLSESDIEVLGAAAVFHDSRRQNDWMDRGHGQRGAEYYQQYCLAHGLSFDERAYLVMAFHDIADNISTKKISEKALDSTILLYDIFKDADALDRFRLAANGLEETMLRTKEARGLKDFAKWLVTKMMGFPKVLMPNRYLIVVDMQNDFITGSMGTPQAQAIVEPVLKKMREYQGNIVLTLDTHSKDYLSTQEGKMIPVPHCITDSWGWQPIKEILQIQSERNGAIYLKPTFGSIRLAQDLAKTHCQTPIEEIELIGLCTDACVVSNALLLKAYLPEVPIYVDATCCAGITNEKHEAALQTMESCLIHVKRGGVI